MVVAISIKLVLVYVSQMATIFQSYLVKSVSGIRIISSVVLNFKSSYNKLIAVQTVLLLYIILFNNTVKCLSYTMQFFLH